MFGRVVAGAWLWRDRVHRGYRRSHPPRHWSSVDRGGRNFWAALLEAEAIDSAVVIWIDARDGYVIVIVNAF